MPNMPVRTENKGQKAKPHATGPGQYRIIGGRWRGRKIAIANGPGLRPTPDRVRETLFNWLTPVISGANCLDMFAGSGSLGLEALSRSAGSVVLVEKQRSACAHLEGEMRRIGAEAVVHNADALKYLDQPGTGFDVVFVDPPYDSDLLAPALEKLENGAWLCDDAYIYLEHRARKPLPAVPSNWQHWRDGRAGKVAFHLFRRHAIEDS